MDRVKYWYILVYGDLWAVKVDLEERKMYFSLHTCADGPR